jgi:short-subunit dehydrogenase
MKLKEKYKNWALVTGASDGIGKDFAHELAKEGFSLYLVARRENKLHELQSELKSKYGIEVKINALDLSDTKSIQRLQEETESIDFGMLVLAAGFGTGGEFEKIPLPEELNMIDLNCRSVVALTHHFIRKSLGKRKLGVVLFGSLVGFQGVPWSTTYAASKAFIQSFAEGLYGEYKGRGIDILSVAPGPVNSGFAGRAGMIMGMSQSPTGIARSSLSALGKSSTVRPGFLSKFLGFSLATAPRGVRSFILKQIMASMVFQGRKK